MLLRSNYPRFVKSHMLQVMEKNKIDTTITMFLSHKHYLHMEECETFIILVSLLILIGFNKSATKLHELQHIQVFLFFFSINRFDKLFPTTFAPIYKSLLKGDVLWCILSCYC